MAAMLIIVATILSGGALAQSFKPVIDEFWIIKNGEVIFRDSFSDGFLPPSGPDGASTYSTAATAGLDGMTSESGGKLTMTPAFGSQTLIGGGLADTFTSGFRLNTTDSSNPNSLLFADAFEVHGLFDLNGSGLPTFTGQSFGIGVTDRFPPSNEGNDELRVLVGRRSSDNALGVVYREQSFIDDTSQLVDFDPLGTFSVGAQIELMLSKAADTNEVLASWGIWTGGTFGGWVVMDNINNETFQAVTIYDGELYTRARFQATDANVNLAAIPEPEIYAMLSVGLGVIGWFGRRRKLKAAA